MSLIIINISITNNIFIIIIVLFIIIIRVFQIKCYRVLTFNRYCWGSNSVLMINLMTVRNVSLFLIPLQRGLRSLSFSLLFVAVLSVILGCFCTNKTSEPQKWLTAKKGSPLLNGSEPKFVSL